MTFERDVWPLRDRVLAFCTHRLHNQAEAEDLTQDTMVAAWANQDQCRGAVAPWVFGIARNNVANYIRTRVRAEAKHVEAPRRVRTDATPEHELELLLAQVRVDRHLAELPEALRALVHDRWALGLGTQELAHRHGLTGQAVRSRIYRARKSLTEVLFS
jgi:RNA polymerase sigma-70 factor (ECF subfamily)